VTELYQNFLKSGNNILKIYIFNIIIIHSMKMNNILV